MADVGYRRPDAGAEDTRTARHLRGDGPFRKKFALSNEELPIDAVPAYASAAQAESLDERAVPVDVDLLQVSQQAATLTHEQQQTTT